MREEGNERARIGEVGRVCEGGIEGREGWR